MNKINVNKLLVSEKHHIHKWNLIILFKVLILFSVCVLHAMSSNGYVNFSL